MAEEGWSRESSPFHPAAREIQSRLGVRERLEMFGRRGIRDYMTEQIRQFVEQLRYVVLAAVDERGRPWASMATGPAGFARASDPYTLTVAAVAHPDDPLSRCLVSDAKISVLGIDFVSRRRNSVNGRLVHRTAGEIVAKIDQSFGNCPQYIQKRTVTTPEGRPDASHRCVFRAVVLGDAERRWLRGADTFFVASHCPGPADDPVYGVDVSHRGGRPGFVRVEDERTLIWPEFKGNSQFHTVGNIAAEPRVGLTFVNFDSGSMLQMTGRAEIVWDGDEVRSVAGSERAIRFRLDELVRTDGAVPLRWRLDELAGTLENTGTWPENPGAAPTDDRGQQDAPIEVLFARSGRRSIWTADSRSLLELAEDLGLTPAYGCRSGMCGSCAVRVVAGDVEYSRPTLHEPEPGTALICKAAPRRRGDVDRCAPRLILDL